MNPIKFEHYIFAFAVTLAPFTLLRFSFFGVSEILVLLLFIGIVFRGALKKNFEKCIFTKFWLFYLTVSFLGLSFNVIYLGYATGTFEGMAFDFAAYSFVLITCYYLEMSIINNRLNAYYLLKLTFYGLSITLLMLYLISFYYNSLFGLTLRQHGRFVPLVENVHQISMILVILPFLALYFLKRESNIFVKCSIFVLGVLAIPMSLETASTKAFLSIIFGSGVFILFSLLFIHGRKFFPIYLMLFFTISSIVAANIDLIALASEFFVENDGHGARASIYSIGFDIGMSSPVVGLGTGPHVPRGGRFWDSHQTYLTIFLQTGAVGVIAYIMLMFNIFKRLMLTPSLIAALTAITVYSFGGDILRRLPIWMILTLIFYTNRQDKKK
jgi:hypothetical protein